MDVFKAGKTVRLLDCELNDDDIPPELKKIEFEERKREARKRSVAHNHYPPGQYDCVSEMRRSSRLRLLEWHKMLCDFYDWQNE